MSNAAAQKTPYVESDWDAFTTVTKAVADPLRATILRILGTDSYGVLELCEILGTAQPALSHHLKVLHAAGLVSRRKEGTRVFYQRPPCPATALRTELTSRIDALTLSPQLAARTRKVLGRRAAASKAFFTEHASDIATRQARICEPSVYRSAVLAHIDAHADTRDHASEIGPGDAELLRQLSTRYASVSAVDNSAAMLEQTRTRSEAAANVHWRVAEFDSLEQTSDLLLAAMVVHHMPSPAEFFQRAHVLVQPGGLLIVVELCAHDQNWAHEACGDLWLGFSPEALTEWAENAGFQSLSRQFLAQSNGFEVQIHTFTKEQA